MKVNLKFIFMSVIGLFMFGLSYGQADENEAIDENVSTVLQTTEASGEVMTELA
jgi:hypothetical protein